MSFQGDDYLILEDLDAKDCIPVKYTETNTIDGFEIEQVDKDIEKIVLSIFDGVSR